MRQHIPRRGARPRTTTLMGACVLACAAGAPAQTALPEVRVIDSASTTEGTYTARELDIGKTGLSPRETPQSVSVITRQQLDDRNVTKLDLAPSTTVSVGTTRQRVRSMVDHGLPAYADGRLLDVPRSTVVGTRATRQDMDTLDVFVELEHRLDNGGLVKPALRDVRSEGLELEASGQVAPRSAVLALRVRY
ncbi:hypothetical protein [Pseudorhodoferax sp. Leaf267]|uniref:hypothetical protein n=1 Tax=Pseudorhodoferax sp. Leaf267 TaxID=1736316 RepID=UPI0007133949|nr:hypothetical protein [Pseudorhodoferax sp. Leaf267]KQP12751.1 hypothetical protein ASF43_21275 [Pseudorhodoferax sp. Leaf267]